MAEAVDAPEREPEAAAAGSDAVGVASFVTGCLGLGPVAIVLGAIGLARWRSGAAPSRRWALAGLVLGIVGTVVAFVLWIVVASDGAAQATAEAHAEVDAINVGNAVVDHFVAHPDDASVATEVTDAGYLVADVEIPTAADVSIARELSYQGSTAFDWCLTVTLSGPVEPTSVAFAASVGVVTQCPGNR